MGRIVVTGASGHFGKAAAEMLMEQVAAEDLILLSRTPATLAAFAQRGATVRAADFDDPASLAMAMAGAEKMLLISTTRVGTRVQQHRAAVEAGVAQGVRHIVYTSLIGGGEKNNPSIEQHDHHATEQLIEASGAAWTHLRDSLYADAIATAMAIPALAAGSKPDNSGFGRLGVVAREDCVATAVGVLTQEGHTNRGYDVTGPELVSIPEAIALIAEMAAKPIELIHVDDEGMYAYFDSLGVPRRASDVLHDGPVPWASEGMVTFGRSVREGRFSTVTDVVERITGRRPKPLREVFQQYRHLWPV